MRSIVSNSYKVAFQKNDFKALRQFLAKKKYVGYFILCDENTLVHCLPILLAACPELRAAEIIETESGEQSKNLQITALLCETLLENKAGRNALLINLGGGVISDLGGFCASIYKRGIDFINLPTTLLAMADASVGGKTGIDFEGVKNALGSFHQPVGVFIYPGFLDTLSARNIKNGLAEIYKMALILDVNFWKNLHAFPLQKLIQTSVELKNELVLKDPFDKGVRQQLNFGHTIGHAIESLMLSRGLDILHGEAIVAGMILEAHLAYQKKMISLAQVKEICQTFKQVFHLISFPFEFKDLHSWLNNDKKNNGTQLKFALISKIGKCKTGISCSNAQIQKSITFYHQLHD